MPYIQHIDSPNYTHINSPLYSKTKFTETLLSYSDNLTDSTTLNHDTETLKWFFKSVSTVDHSYKATTENLNKLVSFYL